MLDVYGVARSKEKILSILRTRGPSLPVQLAKEAGISTLFASAFLSELKSEGKIQISHMRVGSSPLYFLAGQESLLENFVRYLNQREKEAFELLKKDKVLRDDQLTPVLRVALKALKDFAVVVPMNTNGENGNFWKYRFLSDEEFIKIFNERFLESSNKEKTEEKKVVNEELTRKEEIVKKDKLSEEKISVQEVLKSDKKTNQRSNFANKLREHLSQKNIEILSVFLEKKKEFEGIIRFNTPFGKQDFYFVAKDKKTIGDNDLIVLLQKAHARKMPAFFMSNGKLSKKGKEYLREWGNMVKFQELKFS